MKFLLHGPDSFRLRRKLEQVKAQFMKARDASGMNVVRLRAGEHGPDEVAEAFFSSPFLAEKKMVVLEDYLTASAATQEEIAALLGRKPDSTIAVFMDESDFKDAEKSPLYPLLSGEKYTERFPLPTGRDLEKFCVDEAAQAGVTLGPNEARSLVAALGDDLPRLHAEIGKLAAFALGSGQKAVTRPMLAELVPEAADVDIFGFIDACTRGECTLATTMLENLLGGGFSPHQVVSMLERQFRLLVAASDAQQGGRPDPQALAKSLGIHHFPAGKALAATRTRPYDWYLSRHAALLDLDRKSKSGAANIPALLDVFISSLAR